MVKKRGNPAVRPTNTRIIELHNQIKIDLNKDDLVTDAESNESGYIKVNRTGLIGHNVTVILDTIKPEGDTLTVPKDTIMFHAKIMSGNLVSSLSAEFGNEPVTVIIHDVPV